jgi:hypothetical protein
VTAEQFDPQWIDDCPSCARRARELEAAAGERCVDCLERFDRPYRQPAPADPSRCPSCVRVAEYRSTAPSGVSRYGKAVEGR